MAFVAEKGIRIIWCTTCAAAEKCGNFTWPGSGNARVTDDVVREVSRNALRGAELAGSARTNEQPSGSARCQLS